MLNKSIIRVLFFFIAGVIGILGSNTDLFKQDVPQNPLEIIHQDDSKKTAPYKVTPQRRIHILFGDGTGGGHRAGAGKPGKTEFPPSWNDDKIIATALRIANDESLPMRPSGKRYWIRMGEEDGIQIRVVLNPVTGDVITAYPVERRKE